MKITIVVPDSIVGVDGVFRKVDLSGIDADVRAVQFDTEKSRGHVEFNEHADFKGTTGEHQRKPNEEVKGFNTFQPFLDRWRAAAPKPPSAKELAESALAQKRHAALNALQEKLLEEYAGAHPDIAAYLAEKRARG